MGKKCCYKSCCPPPCCPPPCCPQPCNPCCPPPCPPPCPLPCPPWPCPVPCPPWPCNPCNEWFAPGGGCCPTNCCTKKTDFLGQSSDGLGPFGATGSTLLTFTEVRDCGCDYNNNSTFNPKCNGSYTICASVPITTSASGAISVRIDLVTSSGVIKASSSTFSTLSGSTTLNINNTVCLSKCDAVSVNLVIASVSGGATVSIPATLRTFSGYAANCKSSCC